MSGINFLSDNLVDLATLSITTGAANAQFPLSNLKIETTSRKFRSTGNTVVILLDLLQTRAIDTIAVVGDTTVGMGFTALEAKTSVTNDFTLSTPINVTLDSERNIGFEFITPVSHRFIQLTFTGTGSYSEVSNIFIGERINLPLNSFSIGSFRYRNEDMSSNQFNDYGQLFSHVRSYQRRLVGTIEYCTKDETETLDDMFLRHGRHYPLWIILDPDSEAMNDGKFILSMYCYMEKMPSWNAVGGRLYNTSLELNQVV